MQITQAHLSFLHEAIKQFKKRPSLETYRNGDETMIALRVGADRDCIEIYELGPSVGWFVQMLERVDRDGTPL